MVVIVRLKVIKSGSDGNGYILETEKEALVIELGASYKESMKMLDYNVSKIVGAIVSHGHGDHVQCINQYMRAGIPCWCTEGTREEIRISSGEYPYVFKRFPDKISPNGEYVKMYKPAIFGSFIVKPFETIHDSKEPVGFIIEHPEMGRFLFATDTEYIRFKFKGLVNIAIEANYEKEIIDHDIEPFYHIVKGHMSVDTASSFIKDHSDTLQNVLLCHLSSSNSNENDVLDKISMLGNFNAKIANKGVCLELN